MVRLEFHIRLKVKIPVLSLINTMIDTIDKPIDLKKCLVESDGTVTCAIDKEKFNDLQKKNVKLKRVILEIE